MSAEQKLAAAVSADLRAWAAELPAPLQATFAALMAGSGKGADSGAAEYLLAVSQPVVLLPLWMQENLPLATVQTVASSALAAYLAVRLQDDLMDEDAGDPVHVALLGTLLVNRHLALLAGLGLSGAYWQVHAERWSAYADAMLFERQCQQGLVGYDDVAFDRVLDRSRPLLLPGAAMLDLTGRWGELETLRAFVSHCVRAHQRFDDLRDALEDHKRERQTRVLAMANAADAGQLLAWMLQGGAETVIELAIGDSEFALLAAGELSMPDAMRWLDAKVAAMRAWQQHLVGGYLARILGA